MVLKNYVCMCASMCLLKYLVVSLEGKSQELPTISAPIQPVTAPITITICKFPFQFQIQRERERERPWGERKQRKEEVCKESGQTCHLAPPLWASQPFHHCSFVFIY